jgi:DNA polymerase III epsilon subunit-like protein
VLLLLVGGACAAPTHQVNPGVMISEVSLHDPEYVELYNPTDSVISIEQYYLCYYSDTKTSWEDPHHNRKFLEQALIAPHSYYLVGFGGDWASSSVEPDWRPYSSKRLSNRSGAIAVFSGIPSATSLVDAVGWGASTLAEGVSASSPPDDLTLSRTVDLDSGMPFLDTDRNVSDLMHKQPSPCSSATGTTLSILSVERLTTDVEETAIQYELCNRGREDEDFMLEVSDELRWTDGTEATRHELSCGACVKGEVRIMMPSEPCFYILDLETTGVGAYDEIIEIAWAHFCGPQVVQTFSSLVRPHFLYIDPDAQEKHGITIQQILEANAPPIEDILPSLLRELGGNIVVAHSAQFDRRFVEAATTEEGDLSLLNSFVWRDTLSLSRLAFAGLQDYKLASLAVYLGLPEPRHRAISDAFITGLLFRRCLEELGNTVTLTIGTETQRVLSAIVSVRVDIPGI